ncbi:hypothetical protein HMPREF9607_01882 [Cutibacterium modestum HL044PA1]|uniref:Uncharacterized protein n=1 Tax=Cutibacterium modestum HL044PA1 TaxID=765109 RepID=A0ABN0C4B6_9ACTN|nr:hypothetical protein HMPREF9607_01882 [Cutibacterium modestum HL044PA1]
MQIPSRTPTPSQRLVLLNSGEHSGTRGMRVILSTNSLSEYASISMCAETDLRSAL